MLLFIFLLHLIGDYIFQTEKMAEKKEKEVKGLIDHIIVYCLVMVAIPVFFRNGFLLSFFLVIAHTLIDSIMYMIKKQNKTKESSSSFGLYLLDQILHLFSILIIVYFFSDRLNGLEYRKFTEWLISFLKYYGLNSRGVIQILFLFVMLHKPSNIFITKFLSGFSFNKTQPKNNSKDIQAGRYIGTLERLIVMVLIYFKEYTAIAWVLTAKSITRHESITKDEISGEYYLLGTLLSLLIVIVVSYITFNL